MKTRVEVNFYGVALLLMECTRYFWWKQELKKYNYIKTIFIVMRNSKERGSSSKKKGCVFKENYSCDDVPVDMSKV